MLIVSTHVQTITDSTFKVHTLIPKQSISDSQLSELTLITAQANETVGLTSFESSNNEVL